AYLLGPGAAAYLWSAVVVIVAGVGAYLNRHASVARLFALGLVASMLAATYWHLQDFTILVVAAWLFWRDRPPAWQRAWLLVVVACLHPLFRRVDVHQHSPRLDSRHLLPAAQRAPIDALPRRLRRAAEHGRAAQLCAVHDPVDARPFRQRALAFRAGAATRRSGDRHRGGGSAADARGRLGGRPLAISDGVAGVGRF